MSTHLRRLGGGDPNPGGYRTLRFGPGEPHVVRGDALGGDGVTPALGDDADVLLSVAHLSDLHICDSQSPGRVEFLDRFADPDSPLIEHLDEVGMYRAQEGLTTHVVDAMVRAVNGVAAGPVGGAAFDLAIITGDLTDNAQSNELGWYVNLLDGGEVRPDSGDLDRYEGVSDDVDFDERFWHPQSVWPDLPRTKFGFPTVPGLLDSSRQPFLAAGLRAPWLAVHGNHDQLLQGTLAAPGILGRFVTGYRKPVQVPGHWSSDEVLGLLVGLAGCDPVALARLREAGHRRVTRDPARRAITRAEFVAAHFRAGARPHGHGFPAAARGSGAAFYRYDHGPVTFLVMDSVNEYGGWEGSLDLEQWQWLQDELSAADSERRYVVLASHHPLRHFVNDYGSGGRVLAAELEAGLGRHPSVVLWLNGHSHKTTVAAHRGWWEVTSPALIDWPQQGRIVELIRQGGSLMVATTMLDHTGDAPWSGDADRVDAIAGLSRELAANDWQWRRDPLEQHPRSGRPEDRNALLYLADPFA